MPLVPLFAASLLLLAGCDLSSATNRAPLTPLAPPVVPPVVPAVVPPVAPTSPTIDPTLSLQADLRDSTNSVVRGNLASTESIDFDQFEGRKLKLSVHSSRGQKLTVDVPRDRSRAAGLTLINGGADYLLSPGNYELNLWVNDADGAKSEATKLTVKCDLSCRNFKIVVLGSSTSAGTGASSIAKSWVGTLFNNLGASVGAGFTGTNLSVGGFKSGDLLPSSSQTQRNVSAAIALKPDLILVSIPGGNDLAAGLTPKVVQDNLAAIRARAEAAQIPVFNVGAMPRTNISAAGRQALKDLNVTERPVFASCKVASGATYDKCFVDIFDAVAQSDLGIKADLGSGDGIHLNDKGHALLQSLIEPAVRAFVCTRVKCR